MKEGRSLSGRRFQYGVCALLVQLMVGCSSADGVQNEAVAHREDIFSTSTRETQATAATKLIVVFGDSLYAGYQLADKDGFAPVLERQLRQASVDAQVLNAGVSGDTSAAGLQRLAFTLDGLRERPALVLVGLGGNDMLRGLAPAETKRNLDAILAELKRRDIPAMVTGMVAAPNMGRDYAVAFNAIYPDLAHKYNVPLYPFFLDGVVGKRDLSLADGIHPNAKGIALIAAQLSAPVIKALSDSHPAR